VSSSYRDQRDVYFPLTKSIFKSAGITVSHFFSMLPSTLKYLYSVETFRMHFPAKQPCTNDTVCNAAMQCKVLHFPCRCGHPFVKSGAGHICSAGHERVNATYETNVGAKDVKIALQLRPTVLVSYFQKAFNLFINFPTLREPRVMI
jgi:hypothetical protein